jgi:hypothetical protein
VRVAEHAGSNPENGALYEQKLADIQRRLIYSDPKRMIGFCAESFGEKLKMGVQGEDYLFNIKVNPLRLFHYALYASRTSHNITESSFWHVVSELKEKEVISKEDEGVAVSSLKLFLGLRHLIGISLADTKDSVKINDGVIDVLMTDQVRPMLGVENIKDI